MRYQHPDLQKIIVFLRDFGLQLIKKTETEAWFSGYGPDQYVYYARQGEKQYLGGAFEVESRDDLESVLQIPNVRVLSNGIEEMKDAPGGGYIVSIADPEGFPVNFVFGQERKQPQEMPEKLLINYEDEKPRQRKFQRFEPGPAAVHKVSSFQKITTLTL